MSLPSRSAPLVPWPRIARLCRRSWRSARRALALPSALRRRPGRLQDQTGNVVVEFALMGTLFLFLVAIAIQGAFLLNAWLVISDLTEEGARFAAPCYQRSVQACTTTDIQNFVYSQGVGLVDETKLAIAVTPGSGVITVGATYQVPLLAPFIDGLLPNPTTLVATSTMRLESSGS